MPVAQGNVFIVHENNIFMRSCPQCVHNFPSSLHPINDEVMIHAILFIPEHTYKLKIGDDAVVAKV